MWKYRCSDTEIRCFTDVQVNVDRRQLQIFFCSYTITQSQVNSKVIVSALVLLKNASKFFKGMLLKKSPTPKWFLHPNMNVSPFRQSLTYYSFIGSYFQYIIGHYSNYLWHMFCCLYVFSFTHIYVSYTGLFYWKSKKKKSTNKTSFNWTKVRNIKIHSCKYNRQSQL